MTIRTHVLLTSSLLVAVVAIPSAQATRPAPPRATESGTSNIMSPAVSDVKTLTLTKHSGFEKVCFDGNDCLATDDLIRLVASRRETLNAVMSAQQNADAMRQSFASINDQLGECELVSGNLRKLQSAIVKGDLIDWGTVKARIEAANPGKVLDLATRQIKEAKDPDKAK